MTRRWSCKHDAGIIGAGTKRQSIDIRDKTPRHSEASAQLIQRSYIYIYMYIYSCLWMYRRIFMAVQYISLSI
jgi:hypothetical protein